jgi:hypothetical protein
LDHATKAKFILAIHKHSLQALDSGGGVISAGNSNPISGIAGALTAQNNYQAAAPTNTTTVGNQQAGLATQLQNEAAGNGPNPAQQQYVQNAQQIAGSQAALNAQNRALNPGLAARLSSQAGTQTTQQAAGNAAAQQGQQQIAAQGQLANLTGQEQTGAEQAAAINSQVAQNNTNSVNQQQQSILGGLISNIPIIGSLFAKGGDVSKRRPLLEFGGGDISYPVQPMADGGTINVPGSPSFSNASITGTSQPNQKAMSSFVGKWLNGAGSSDPGATAGLPMTATSANNFGAGDFFSGDAPALGADLSSAAPAAALMKKGGQVKAKDPKQKANTPDDSLKNDKIPALLSQGEIVIPRHITMHPQAAQKAAAFVQAVLNKRRMSTAA